MEIIQILWNASGEALTMLNVKLMELAQGIGQLIETLVR